MLGKGGWEQEREGSRMEESVPDPPRPPPPRSQVSTMPMHMRTSTTEDELSGLKKERVRIADLLEKLPLELQVQGGGGRIRGGGGHTCTHAHTHAYRQPLACLTYMCISVQSSS